jgi:hypothetical protein
MDRHELTIRKRGRLAKPERPLLLVALVFLATRYGEAAFSGKGAKAGGASWGRLAPPKRPPSLLATNNGATSYGEASESAKAGGAGRAGGA